MVLSIHDLGVRKIPEHVGIFAGVVSTLAIRADADGIVAPGLAVLRTVNDPIATQSTSNDGFLAAESDYPIIVITAV